MSEYFYKNNLFNYCGEWATNWAAKLCEWIFFKCLCKCISCFYFCKRLPVKVVRTLHFFYHSSHFSLFPIFGHTVRPDVYFAIQTTNIFFFINLGYSSRHPRATATISCGWCELFTSFLHYIFTTKFLPSRLSKYIFTESLYLKFQSHPVTVDFVQQLV